LAASHRSRRSEAAAVGGLALLDASSSAIAEVPRALRHERGRRLAAGAAGACATELAAGGERAAERGGQASARPAACA